MCPNITPAKHNRFCSRECFYKSMRGVPNPITRERNLRDNPIKKPGALEKMRKSKTGVVQPEITKRKRSKSLKEFYANDPDARERLARNVWDRYTSKIAGTGWAKVRVKALERDSFTCQNCGETNPKLIVVHHRDYRGRNLPSKSDMNNDLANLVTLCHKCHNGIHRHKSKDYKERMQKLQDDNPVSPNKP
jgi:5-methylcytosine-specific restriction endonuclease McrA